MVLGRLQVGWPHRGTWRDGVCFDWRLKPRTGDPTWTDRDGGLHYVPRYRFIRLYIQW
jgi:hypothetical protein